MAQIVITGKDDKDIAKKHQALEKLKTFDGDTLLRLTELTDNPKAVGFFTSKLAFSMLKLKLNSL